MHLFVKDEGMGIAPEHQQHPKPVDFVKLDVALAKIQLGSIRQLPGS